MGRQKQTADGKRPSPAEPTRSRSPTGGAHAEQQRRLQQLHARVLQLSPEHPFGDELVLEDCVEESPGLLLRCRNFLAPFECRKMREVIDSVELKQPNGKDMHPRKGEAFLCRENLSFEDPALSEALWQRLRPLLQPFEGRPPTGFVSLRYYRYLRGHRFGEHVDVSSRSADGTQETEYTLLLYLNSEGDDGEDGPLRGGETAFYGAKRKVLLEQPCCEGTLLLHAHGRRCLMHEGREVTKGRKYLLRTDVLYQREA
eukprot:TRINITY_DN1633_c0_g2_i1.p1 TRINITY_DN1633_c0_g2~~TRINITY_DN1633_c0_g2_i1.p1  ORF type:complete len:257 (+),score=94.08 TRINITY_DN1633_c0_g2_i1:72-842(+)